MQRAKYKRPPITEAVIEIQLSDDLPSDVVGKLHTRLKRSYEVSEPIPTIGVELDVVEKATTIEEMEGRYKLTSSDQADILMISPRSLGCSRLPPYPGWESFSGLARQRWRTWKKVTGYRNIARVGVRYINRVDIPLGDDAKLKVEDYVLAYLELPKDPVTPGLVSFAFRAEIPAEEIGCTLRMNSSSALPPLVNHGSIVLDLDFVRMDDVPQNDKDLWILIDAIGEYKDRAFEACITDKARELFDR